MVSAAVKNALLEDSRRVLANLGVKPKGRSFTQTAWAVAFAAESMEQLECTTKLLYPIVAKQFKTNWKAVERNVRSVTNKVWQKCPDAMQELAGQELSGRPTPKHFLRILCEYVINQQEDGVIHAACNSTDSQGG